MESIRKGWWSSHKYHRRESFDISGFCGWPTLEALIEKCQSPRDKGLVSSLFETGGRAEEVLSLRPEQFEDRGDYVLILGMPVMKQRDTRRQKRHVPMWKTEPLLTTLMEYVESCKGQEKLFPRSYDWLYKKITDLDKNWWPHRFRAERATQLHIERGYGISELMTWFGWSTAEMPTEYTRLSMKELLEKPTEQQLSEVVKLLLKGKI